jgi:predicted dinucleotide-binding enzyme
MAPRGKEKSESTAKTVKAAKTDRVVKTTKATKADRFDDAEKPLIGEAGVWFSGDDKLPAWKY